MSLLAQQLYANLLNSYEFQTDMEYTLENAADNCIEAAKVFEKQFSTFDARMAKRDAATQPVEKKYTEVEQFIDALMYSAFKAQRV